MAISGTTPIAQYKLRVQFDDKTGQSTKWLECKSAIGSESAVGTVHLFFSASGKGGFRTQGSGNIVYSLSDPDAFFAVYHMLQTEKPVLIHWSVRDDNTVSHLEVSTADEPTGEFEPNNL